MAGQLVQVATNTVTSAVSSVDIIGTTTDDVYVLVLTNVTPSTDGADLQMRFTESGTANTTANYDMAYNFLPSNTSISNSNVTNATAADLSGSIGSASGESLSQIQYIYNANNSSEYTFYTLESTYWNNGNYVHGIQGGGVFTVTSAVDGVQYYMDSGNISAGTFTLYKVI